MLSTLDKDLINSLIFKPNGFISGIEGVNTPVSIPSVTLSNIDDNKSDFMPMISVT